MDRRQEGIGGLNSCIAERRGLCLRPLSPQERRVLEASTSGFSKRKPGYFSRRGLGTTNPSKLRGKHRARPQSFAAQPVGTCSSTPRLHCSGPGTLGCQTSGTGVPAPGDRPPHLPPSPQPSLTPRSPSAGPATASFPKLVQELCCSGLTSPRLRTGPGGGRPERRGGGALSARRPFE